MKESDLYPILESHYQKLGYTVKGEVCGCDLVAIRDSEIIIVELKLTFNVKLLYQAVRRLLITSNVYVAIPKPKTKQKASYWTMLRSLSRRLHLGLIMVSDSTVKILAEPALFKNKILSAQRNKLLTEFEGRLAGHNVGGVTGKKIITAYMESSMLIAVLLAKHKKMSAVKLKELGTSSKTWSILSNNHYEWFEKKSKGIYGLKKGTAIKIKKQYPDLWNYYSQKID